MEVFADLEQGSEAWRPVVTFEGYYEVSDFGRVRSIDRTLSSGRHRRGKMLSPKTSKSGHQSLCLCRGGTKSWHGVHRIVLTAFKGPPPALGMEGEHNNGIPSDNRLGNLRWDTPKGNAADRVIHGTEMFGMKNPRAKLTDEQVTEVFAMSRRGMRGKDIAVMMRCTPANISSILTGKHRRQHERPNHNL